MDKAISDMHAGLKTSEAIVVRRDSQTRQLPENLQILDEISKNLWWSWTMDGANIFRDLDSHLWESTEQNPIRVLREVSELRLFQRANDASFVGRVENLGENFAKYLAESPKDFGTGKLSTETPVAYFCAEYGVHNSLPLYSGGLGILAGDHLKSASDLNVPLVAIGLFYHYGYFRQLLSSEGLQLEHYHESVPSNLAIEPVLGAHGEHLKISVKMRGREVFAHIWCAEIGRIKLYLLDTQVAENAEIDRLITGYLYGGDRETRVVQEMMLGIGGVRLLRKLEITPSVYHLNEGHSAFLTLELAREFLVENETSTFENALQDVRQKCVFTTHTPVAAGNESFAPDLIDKCFGEDFADSLILTREEFFKLGKKDVADEEEWFGVTPLSLRMCRSANGVSEKHGEVSRELWLKMFPEAKKISSRSE